MKNESEKKQYEKPAIIYTQPMESVAGACTTDDPVNGKTGSDDLCTMISS
jgi:hypothetical protein